MLNRERRAVWRRALNNAPSVFLLIPVGALGGFFFDWLEMPVAWMMGATIFSLLFNIVTRRIWTFSRVIYRQSIVLIMVTIGLAFEPDAPRLIFRQGLPIGLIIVATIALSVLVGVLVARWTATDRVTALLASVPAGASAMVVFGGELGADQRFIAALQYLRMLSIVTVIPFMVVQSFDRPETPLVAQAISSDGASITGLPAVMAGLALGTFGLFIAQRLRVPTAVIMGPLTAIVVARVVGFPVIVLPEVVVNAAFMGLGVAIGSQFDLPTIARIGRAFVTSAGLMIGFIVSCGLLGVILYVLTDLSLLTAILATTPGGTEVVTVTALEMGGDPSMVASIQMLRLFALLFLVPWLVRMIQRGEPAAAGLEVASR